jgi:membrane-associated phospholipid phosphatase
VWPAIAVAAMFVLGWAVGKRSTPLDDWFHHFGRSPARWLLFFTDPWMLMIVVIFGVTVAVYLRRRRLAVMMAVAPLVGIVLAQLLKRFFGRRSGGVFAYPSGHTTAAVIVFGMLVLLVGATVLSVAAAATVAVLAMIGQGVTYHYFTDTVGGLLLGSAVVCVAALAVKLDTRQPRLRRRSHS